MEKEISSGTMLGIVLIALAVIISLGFGIFSIAKGTANEGVAKVQTNLANVQASEFTDYDQKVVTGTQVKSSLSNFEGKPVAILIGTKALRDAEEGLVSFAGEAGKDLGDLNLVTWDNGDVQINYNALLRLDRGEFKYDGSQGCYVFTGGFDTGPDGSAVQFYNIIGDMNKSGMTEYVNPGSKFNANLIKDASGSTIGIIFNQINTN